MEGDSGFERFVSGSSTRLLRTAILLTGDRAAAEDLLQTTLMRVAGRWGVARRSPEAYARTVLINLTRDRGRQAGRRVVEVAVGELDSLGEAAPRDGDHADAVVGRDAVITALARLPDRQREVLVLRFYADLSVAETAVATGAAEGTVKSYTSRALARMRQLLADPIEAVPNATEVRHEQ